MLGFDFQDKETVPHAGRWRAVDASPMHGGWEVVTSTDILWFATNFKLSPQIRVTHKNQVSMMMAPPGFGQQSVFSCFRRNSEIEDM